MGWQLRRAVAFCGLIALVAWPGLNDASAEVKPRSPERIQVKEKPHRTATGLRPNPQAPEAVAPYPAVETRRPAYRTWKTKHHNGGAWDTTSNPRDLDQEVRQGARILEFRDGRYAQTLHRQYPSSCGPASLAIVLQQLGVTRPPSRPGYQTKRNVDGQDTETVDVGYPGSMEHLMWLGFHRERLGLDMGGWYNREPRFMDQDGVLNTSDSPETRSVLALDGDMDYLPFNQIPSWLWYAPAVGSGGANDAWYGLTGIMNYIYSGGRNGPWRDAHGIAFRGRNAAEVVAARRIIKGFIDHRISIVAGVDSGRHFNAVIGYRGEVSPASADFWVYTADPLNGWGRSNDDEQPGTWRRIAVTGENLGDDKGLLTGIIAWNQHAAGGADVGFRPDGWAFGVDRENGNDWLTGARRVPPRSDPLHDPLARSATRIPQSEPPPPTVVRETGPSSQPPPPTAVRRTGTSVQPPPPTAVRRTGTSVQPPPPTVVRRTGTSVQPPPPPTRHRTESSGWQVGTDRPGGDYRDLRMRQGDPTQCQRACERDARCRTWTLVRAGIQGPEARCWLKDSVPGPVRNESCVSGVKRR